LPPGGIFLFFSTNAVAQICPGRTLRIYGQNGAIVLEQTNLGNTYTISTRLWPAGIYYLQWRAGNRVYQKKFVKAQALGYHGFQAKTA